MTLAQASGCMALAIFLSRVLGLIRDAVISAQFGLQTERDAYVTAFIIPDLLFFLLAGGALSSAFIPVFTRLWTQGDTEKAWNVFSTLATLMFVLTTVFVVLAGIFALPIIETLAPGLAPKSQVLAADLSRVILPSQYGFLLGGLMFGTMNARKHFLIPAMAPNIYNLGIIFGALALTPMLGGSIFGLAWGALTGALLGSLMIPLFAMVKFGFNFAPRMSVADPEVKRVFKIMLPVVLGLSLPGVYAVVLRAFGSHFGEGAISALDIANRIMQAPLGIFGQSMAVAIFPTLIEMHVKNQSKEYLAVLSKSLRTVLFLGLFISALMFVLSEDIVRMFNQWGKFSSADTGFVAQSLAFYSLGVFAWCAHPILVRAFFSMEDSLTPILMGTFTSIVFVGLCFLLTRFDIGFGYAGLALSVSLAAVLLLILLLLGLRSRLGRIDGKRVLRTLMVGSIASIVLAGAVWWVQKHFVFPEGVFGNFASAGKVLLLALASFWVYVLAGKKAGLEEVEYIYRLIPGRETPSNPQSEDR